MKGREQVNNNQENRKNRRLTEKRSQIKVKEKRFNNKGGKQIENTRKRAWKTVNKSSGLKIHCFDHADEELNYL